MHTSVVTPESEIHNRALLVWLTITTWSARKHDKRATAKVTADFQTSSDAARVNKSLLPGDAAEYKALMALAGSIRTGHYGHTLAWSDEGWRLLPTANFEQYTKWLREQQSAFEKARDSFVAEYPTLRADAQRKLNGLWQASDYPEASDIAERFALTVAYSPVPATGDIRVDLAADHIATIEQTITDRVTAATSTAMSDAWQRLYTCVAHIHDRLNDPKAIFRDSLVENARIVCDTLTRLNITADPNLEAMRARVANDLTAYTPETLRDVPAVRQETAEKAAAIMDAMAGFYQVQS